MQLLAQSDLYRMSIQGQKVDELQYINSYPNSSDVNSLEVIGKDKILVSDKIGDHYQILYLDEANRSVTLLTSRKTDSYSPTIKDLNYFLTIQNQEIVQYPLSRGIGSSVQYQATFLPLEMQLLERNSIAVIIQEEGAENLRLGILDMNSEQMNVIAFDVGTILKTNKLKELLFISFKEDVGTVKKYNLNNGQINSIVQLPKGARNFDLYGNAEHLVCTINGIFYQYHIREKEWKKWIDLQSLDIQNIQNLYIVSNEIYFTSR